MLAWFIVVAWILIAVFLHELHGPRFRKNKTGARYYFAKNSLEFLIPCAIVGSLYYLVCLIASRAGDFASLQLLIRMEESLSAAKSYLSILKLNALQVCGVFLVFYLLSLLQVPLDTRSRMSSAFARYRVVARRIYTVLLLLCSFTLFGTQLGSPTRNLNVHIKTIRDGYADLRKEAKEAVCRQVAARLHDKILDSFPPSYRDALELPGKVDAEVGSLRAWYAQARASYGVRVVSADSILAQNEQRDRIASPKTVLVLHAVADSAPESASAVPGEMSAPKVNRAKTALEGHRSRSSSRLMTFLRVREGKEFVCKLPTILTHEFKTQAFGQLIEAYPIVEPLVDVFVRTANDELDATVGKSVDKVVNAVGQDPSQVDRVIDDEASRIVSTTNIKIPTETLEKANKAQRQLQTELKVAREARMQIDREVRHIETAMARKLIAQISSPSETTRVSAAEKLAGMGSKLSKQQVDELVRIMRNGRRKFVTSRTRIQHCTDCEYTSVRYYAADALECMQSPYVSEKIVAEATTTKGKSQTTGRVNDPGWI